MVLFALAVGLHAADEATHDFLTAYNAAIQAIRSRRLLLPLPTFTFPVWRAGVIAGILLLLCLSSFAFRGNRLLCMIAFPLAFIVGVFNAALHICGSLYFHRWMPGVYSSPILLAAAFFLLHTAPSQRLFRRAEWLRIIFEQPLHSRPQFRDFPIHSRVYLLQRDPRCGESLRHWPTLATMRYMKPRPPHPCSICG